jgi:hypothetical protein
MVFATMLLGLTVFVPLASEMVGELLYLAALWLVGLLVFGAAHVAVAWGLWTLRKWAWIGAMLISGVYATGFLLNFPERIPLLTVPAAVVIYLYSQRSLFLSEPTAADTY